MSLNGSEPYEPKEVNQQFLDNCNSWVTMKEMIGHSGENLRQSMVTPWNVNEPISAEEFLQQAEVMKEVSIVYSFRYSPIGDGARGARAPLSLHTNVVLHTKCKLLCPTPSCEELPVPLLPSQTDS